MKYPRFSPVLFVPVLFCVAVFLCTPAWSATSLDTPDTAQASRHAGGVLAPGGTILIPGPQRSFLRMAGISQKVSPDEILALLARTVWMKGFEYTGPRDENGNPTELLILIKRYVDQARALTALAGPEGVIRVANCQQSKPLLDILGYRPRMACGSDTSVETVDPERAFITIESGFPLAQLEETLRTDKPFTYPYSGFAVPVLFTPDDWVANTNTPGKKDELVDTLLRNPTLARLYWAFSRIDNETATALQQSPGLQNLKPLAALLDFYGSNICIRSGRVLVPGGAPAETAWQDLVGADPRDAAKFVTELLSKDEGWPAVYFDVLSRLTASEQSYFTEPSRLKIFYNALVEEGLEPGPARSIFRPAPGLLLLVSRLQFEKTGEPHFPGNLEVWRSILSHKNASKVVRQVAKRAVQWNDPQKLLEAMFSMSRMPEQDSPVQLYLLLSGIDRGRAPDQKLSAQTIQLMANNFSRFNEQFLVFSEFHDLNDISITQFLTATETIDRVSKSLMRANTAGILQANLGLWQILARQGQISSANLNDSWQSVIKPFMGVRNSVQLFDAGRTSLRALLRFATGNADLSENEIITLLAGPNQASPEGKEVRQIIGSRIRTVMEDQRLVSLDTLFALADGMNQLAQGKTTAATLLPLAREIQEFEMPRPLFTSGERTEWTMGVYDSRYAMLQMRTNLIKLFKGSPTPKQLTEARGALAPVLKNTLVGLNYAYYEPPGAQMLHHNPLFVRSHDFTGQMTIGGGQTWQLPRLFGTGLTANGGAYLAGSLAGLPYVLSDTEQNFLIPENVQALIWQELVPGLLTSAILPRWWSVTRNELHAVTLYQRTGEELLESAAQDADLRQKVMNILSDRMVPQRSEQVQRILSAGKSDEIPSSILPGEAFYLAVEYRRRFPEMTTNWGTAGKELENLAHSDPAALNWERLSEDFGIPHPVLSQSYARELLTVKPFPAFMGFPSRMLAESWDSSNLYWARLADEMGYSPVVLNRIVPELTHRMVEKIFATDFEDWPAVLRAMHETGDEFRQGKLASLSKSTNTAQP
jgi:hypothetical protein